MRAWNEKRGKFGKINFLCLVSFPTRNLYSIHETARERSRSGRRKGRRLKIKWKINTFVQSIISDGAKLRKKTFFLLIKVKHIKFVRFSECAIDEKEKKTRWKIDEFRIENERKNCLIWIFNLLLFLESTGRETIGLVYGLSWEASFEEHKVPLWRLFNGRFLMICGRNTRWKIFHSKHVKSFQV